MLVIHNGSLKELRCVILPYNAVTFFRFAEILKKVPNLGSLSAKTDRNILIEAANGID